jgi:RES domain-containing protein
LITVSRICADAFKDSIFTGEGAFLNGVIDNKSAILRVPSIVSKQEYNYLFNPKHPDFSKITLHETAAFTFDPRLLKQE